MSSTSRATMLATGLALLAAAAMIPGPAAGQDQKKTLTLDEYVKLLPNGLGALKDTLVTKESGELGAKDPVEWQRFCEGEARSEYLAANKSGPAAAENTKKDLRYLWMYLATFGHDQYSFQTFAENSLNGIATGASTIGAKLDGWSKQIKNTNEAVVAFDDAVKKGKDKDILKAAWKLRTQVGLGSSVLADIAKTRDYFETITTKGDRRLDHVKTELTKRKDNWNNMGKAQLDLPGVKEFVAGQKKEIDEVLQTYTDSINALTNVTKSLVGENPKIITDAGVKDVKFPDLLNYWKGKSKAAAVEIGKRKGIPTVD